MRLRTVITDVVLAMFALVLAGVTLVTLWPIEEAAELSMQSKIVALRMQPRLALHNIEMSIEVTDANLLSRYLRKSSAMRGWVKGGAAEDLLTLMGSETAAFALDVKFLDQCKVYLSSQSMVIDSPIARLSYRLGSSSLAWRMVATHEAAHCFEKPASWMKTVNFEEAEAQSFLSEAFADAYVIGDLWLQDRDGAIKAAQAFKEFRSGMESPTWATGGAISLMTEKLQKTWPTGMNSAINSKVDSQGAETGQDSELIKSMAKESALAALPAHLQMRGRPACEVSDRKITCNKLAPT